MLPIMKPTSLYRSFFYVKVWSVQLNRTITSSTNYRINECLASTSSLIRGINFCKEILWNQSIAQAVRMKHTMRNSQSVFQDKYTHKNKSKRSPKMSGWAHNLHFQKCFTSRKSDDMVPSVSSVPSLVTKDRNLKNALVIHSQQQRFSHNGTESSLKLESSSESDQQLLRIDVGRRSLVIPALWLRDHCRSSKYYNHETHQKNADPDLLTRNLKIDSVEMTTNSSGVTIVWNDGHVSEFNMDWLLSNYYNEKSESGTRHLLWDRDNIESQPLPVVSYDDHMTLEAGLSKTVSNICKYGFSIVEGADATEAATEKVVQRLTFVQETLFGKMWTFTSDAQRSDTAYSTLALGSHTDLTYMDTPAGIQVFHCLKHTGTGGETLLVDGFRCLKALRQTHPEDFEFLKNTVVPHEYKENPSPDSPGYHLYSLGTTIRTHPSSGELIQIRFNPYDRAPLNTVPATEIPTFYRAYGRLIKIISDPVGHFWHRLKPGQVIFIDNWRVMHGRSAFAGTRVMCGCYLPRDEWVSKARMLGVW